jgi:hypothetical protein
MRVERDGLRLSAAVGSGSQGTIYRVERADGTDFGFPLIYKEFAPKTAVSGAALELMAAFRSGLPEPDQRVIDQRTVWPCAAVVRKGRVCGYLMQAIPAPYMQTIVTMTGSEPIPREVQHLFVSEAIARKNLGEIPTRVERLTLAREMAFILGFLHKRELVYGDLSYKNAVYALRPQPMVVLLDCDAVRLKGQGAAVTQLNSPGWGAPEKGPQTIETDRYKLALFIMRCLTPGVNAQNRDPAKATRAFDAAGMALLRRGLGEEPEDRPSGKDWVVYLDAAIQEAGGVKVRTGVAARPAPAPKVAARAGATGGGATVSPRRTTGLRPIGPYPLPPKPVKTRTAFQPHRWVQPHRVPSRIRGVRPSVPTFWQARAPSTLPTYVPTKAQLGMSRVVVVTLWLIVLSFFGIAALSAGLSSRGTPTASVPRVTGGANGSSTTRSTLPAAVLVPPAQSAPPAAENDRAKAGDEWTFRSVASGDHNVASGTLGTYITSPSVWTFVLVGPRQPTADGTMTQPVRTYTVTGGATVRQITQTTETVAADAPAVQGLPGGWPFSMEVALAAAGKARPNEQAVAYAWRCKADATSTADCVWRFTFGGPSGEALIVAADSGTVIPTPDWLS